MTNWQPLDTHPKNGDRFLVYGKWKPYLQLVGGTSEIQIGCWSTLESRSDAEYRLMIGFNYAENWNVDWTHWAPMPEGPK